VISPEAPQVAQQADRVSDLPLSGSWPQTPPSTTQGISKEVFAQSEQAALSTVKSVAAQLLQAAEDLHRAAVALNKHGHGYEANQAMTASLRAKREAQELLG